MKSERVQWMDIKMERKPEEMHIEPFGRQRMKYGGHFEISLHEICCEDRNWLGIVPNGGADP
jgi:hypothetical protein